jgi:hypothetical protein
LGVHPHFWGCNVPSNSSFGGTKKMNCISIYRMTIHRSILLTTRYTVPITILMTRYDWVFLMILMPRYDWVLLTILAILFQQIISLVSKPVNIKYCYPSHNFEIKCDR